MGEEAENGSERAAAGPGRGERKGSGDRPLRSLSLKKKTAGESGRRGKCD